MKNIVKSQHKNWTGSLESIKLSNDTVISRADVIKNILDGSQTYFINEAKVNVVENKYLRVDTQQLKSDELGTLVVE